MKKKTINKTYAVFLDDVEQAKYTSLNMAKPLYDWLIINHPDKNVKIIKSQSEIIELWTTFFIMSDIRNALQYDVYVYFYV